MRKEIIIGISTAIGTTLLLYLAGKITQFPTVLVPSSAVVAFRAASCPDGWKEFEDARGRFILGVGKGKAPDLTLRTLLERNGEEEHELTTREMPKHEHEATAEVVSGNSFEPGSRRWSAGGSAQGTKNWVGQSGAIEVTVDVTPIGESIPHNNMPPYLALLFCEKQ